MNFQEYSEQAIKTASTDKEHLLPRISHYRTISLLHAALGMSSEAGEVFEWLAAPSVTPEAELIAELGDCLWYANLVVAEFGLSEGTLIRTAAVLADELFDPGSVFENIDMGADLLATAAGKVCDLTKALIFYGRIIDLDHLTAALDVYLSGIILCCRALKVTLDEVMDKNIAKLRARYGEAFSEERANSRDLKKEKAAYTKE